MNKIMLKVMFIVVGLFVAGLLMGPPAMAVEIGSPAPEFILLDSSGEDQSLSQYAGKIVVLEWLNHDCPFVKKHYGSQNMQNLQEKYTEQGVIWLSIISSAPGKQGHCSPPEAQKLSAEKKVQATSILLDSSGEVGRLYGAKTTPHMFVIDPAGVLIYQGAIDSVPSADAADIPEATNYVAAALDAVLNGQPVPISSTKSYGCSVKY